MVDINLSTLNGRNGFIIPGLDESGLLGDAVSNAGDINNDSKGDIIIGARGTDIGNRNDTGKLYVIFGRDEGFDADFNLASLDGSNGFSIEGLDARDFLGVSVSNAEDVNNDGFKDIIIGANGNNNNAGASYVIFGQENFAPNIDLASLDGNDGFSISGLISGDSFGTAVSDAGDINGDNIPDLIISATGATTNGNQDTGASYVIFGRDNFNSNFNLASLDGSNGFVINGIDPRDSIGISVSSAGDINNDEIDDLIIGAPNAGQVYILFGSRDNFTPRVNLSNSLNGINGFVINGIESRNGTGFSVADAGDINGDEIDDIIIGASSADLEGRENAGQAYVVFGQETGFSPTLELSNLNGTDGFTVNGTATDDLLGTSVSGAGDVNGDGVDDIIIGATENRLVNETSGTSYVVFGRKNDQEFPDVLELNDLTVAEGFAITSDDDTNILLGQAVSGAGDVNGDGIDDVIVGAPLSDPEGNDSAGESYVIFGGVTYLGDINNDSAYTSADAYGISRLAAGLDPEFPAYPGIDPVAVADVNGDGVVSAFDASVVASVANGIESPFLPEIPT